MLPMIKDASEGSYEGICLWSEAAEVATLYGVLHVLHDVLHPSRRLPFFRYCHILRKVAPQSEPIFELRE